ncbi:MAG: exonuclease domain-containing protein, partial [Gammaproteobacteria bacterium]
MKQIILDTETTGLDIQSGNRVIEIGCVEIIDRKFTGREF